MLIASLPDSVKVRPDAAFPSGAADLDLAGARNEFILGQLVLRTNRTTDSTVSVHPLVGEDGDELPAEVFRQHYIEVTQATTPAFEPGWYPDALIPVTGSISVPADANLSLWVRIRIPETQPHGLYRGSVHIDGRKVPVTLRVWDFSLPEAGHSRTAFALWYDQIAEFYGVENDSPEHWELAEQFYWFQLDYRLPPDDLPISPHLTAVDWLASAMRFLRDPRVIAYRIPARTADPAWTAEVIEGLRRAGLLNRGYLYLDEIDEPTAGGTKEPNGGAARVRGLCKWLDELAPEVEHLVTTEPVPELEGSVRTWVPLFDRYDAADARRRRGNGERFWWYGCIYPTHPYPSYHIDDDLMAARVVPWLMHRDGIEGNLYWATNIFGAWDGGKFVRRDPWTDPVAWPTANGDGRLIYPGPDGPLPSIRLEAIRAGQQDYEYLRLLNGALGDAGVDEPDSVVAGYRDRIARSATHFDRGGHAIESVRRAIADHILRLRGGALSEAPKELPEVLDRPGSEDLVPRVGLSPLAGEIRGFRRDTSSLQSGPVGEERPWIRWEVDGLCAADSFEARLASHAQTSTALFVVFTRDDGVRHEAARVMVPADGSTRVAVPISLSLMDPARIRSVQLEMMQHQPGADLELGDVRISGTTASATPQGG
jgi:hypothetical protein